MSNTIAAIVGLIAIILVFVVFIAGEDKQPKSYPTPDGYVTDTVGVLNDDTIQVGNTLARDYREKNYFTIAALVVDTTGRESIEQYSIGVAQSWGLGEAGVDNGVLLLIAVEDRDVRIEVGRGLEGALTDAEAGRILDDVVLPHLRDGNYDSAVLDGIVAINESILAD